MAHANSFHCARHSVHKNSVAIKGLSSVATTGLELDPSSVRGTRYINTDQDALVPDTPSFSRL
jgi:hypothetical protein